MLLKPASQLRVRSLAYADWGTNREDRRSVSGFCTFLGPNPHYLVSRKQQVVSRSTTGAEYRSVADAVTEVMWVTSLLKEMQITTTYTPLVWCDNSGTVALASNPALHSKTKHVELDLHFVHEKVTLGLVQVGYVPAAEQVADILTKPLSYGLFDYFRTRLNIKGRDTVAYFDGTIMEEEEEIAQGILDNQRLATCPVKVVINCCCFSSDG